MITEVSILGLKIFVDEKSLKEMKIPDITIAHINIGLTNLCLFIIHTAIL